VLLALAANGSNLEHACNTQVSDERQQWADFVEKGIP